MGSWRDAAAALQGEVAPVAAPSLENFGLPDDLAAALRRLERMPAPRKLERPQNWGGVIADAMTLARDRWAAKAIALGWTAGDLFGVGVRDDWDFQGLAVWLDGRRIVMLDDKQAIVVGKPTLIIASVPNCPAGTDVGMRKKAARKPRAPIVASVCPVCFTYPLPLTARANGPREISHAAVGRVNDGRLAQCKDTPFLMPLKRQPRF